jgi:hypothetical protein
VTSMIDRVAGRKQTWASCAAWCLGVLGCTGWHCGAQVCPPEWQEGQEGRIITGSVRALQAFDPDGAGPLGTWLIAGGSPSGPTGVFAGKVIVFDGTSWRSLDSVPAVSGNVAALSVFNGQLVAGGSFGSLGGVVASGVARWNGTTWEPMGAGIGGGSGVSDFAVYNGALIAGGDFWSSGATTLDDLARWHGSNWVPFGTTSASGRVNALATVGNSLYAGGLFSSVNGVATSNLARWNGTSWIASGQPGSEVTALASYSSVSSLADRLFVGGDFSSIGGQSISRVAIFSPNAGTWQAAGAPPAGRVSDLFVRSSGVSSYQLSAAIGGRHYIFGSGTWAPNGEHGGGASRIGLYSGQYVLARTSGFMDESAVVAWNGTQWSAPGVGVPSNISCLQDKGDGSLVVGGFSLDTNRTRSRNFAWQLTADGITWTQLGGELRHQNSPTSDFLIKAFARMPNGDTVMGGRFAGIGDVTAPLDRALERFGMGPDGRSVQLHRVRPSDDAQWRLDRSGHFHDERGRRHDDRPGSLEWHSLDHSGRRYSGWIWLRAVAGTER